MHPLSNGRVSHANVNALASLKSHQCSHLSSAVIRITTRLLTFSLAFLLFRFFLHCIENRSERKGKNWIIDGRRPRRNRNLIVRLRTECQLAVQSLFTLSFTIGCLASIAVLVNCPFSLSSFVSFHLDSISPASLFGHRQFWVEFGR